MSRCPPLPSTEVVVAVNATVAAEIAGQSPAAQAHRLRIFITIAAGRLAHLEGADHAMTVLANVSASMCGGRA